MNEITLSSSLIWGFVAIILLNAIPIPSLYFTNRSVNKKCEEENELEKKLCEKDRSTNLGIAIAFAVIGYLIMCMYISYIYYRYPNQRF